MNFFPEQVTIGLTEIPDEISLIIPLAGCGHECEGCHSPEYQNEKNGEHLTGTVYELLLKKYFKKVSCICFFGGESDLQFPYYTDLAKYEFGYKTALYSGYQLSELPDYVLEGLDFIKVGPYIPRFGGIQEKTTNQRLYAINYNNPSHFIDITHKFWRNND